MFFRTNGNKVAHALATLAFSDVEFCWIEEILFQLNQIITDNVISIFCIDQ